MNAAMTEAATWLDEVPSIDWSDFETAAAAAAGILERLAEDKPLLTRLTRAAGTDPHLRPLCECHAFDDKIVIYDSLESRGFRIRWRLANSPEYERAHTHRFSFATRVLVGAHFETLYSAAVASEEALTLDDVEPLLVKEIVAGQTFTIHHRTVHSTRTAPGTIGLLLRGPAEKRQAPIVRKGDGEKWFRYGSADETPERRAEIAMPGETFDAWLDRLTRQGLIS